MSMNWIFVIVVFALILWNIWITDDRDYWRDLAETKDTDNERENDKLIEMVNRPKGGRL